jgi:hypothetical protein
MTDGANGAATPEDEHTDEDEARRERARRRRRVDRVFGDALPSTSGDQREPGYRDGFSVEHYRASQPPHWGEKK